LRSVLVHADVGGEESELTSALTSQQDALQRLQSEYELTLSTTLQQLRAAVAGDFTNCLANVTMLHDLFTAQASVVPAMQQVRLRYSEHLACIHCLRHRVSARQ
jgi:hypothetical protein